MNFQRSRDEGFAEPVGPTAAYGLGNLPNFKVLGRGLAAAAELMLETGDSFMDQFHRFTN